MKKIIILLFLVLFFGGFAEAQLGSQLGDIEQKIESSVEALEENVDELKEFTDESKQKFVGSPWKSLLLENKFFAGINAFFSKINIVFVVLFNYSWEISWTLFFVFCLWLFTLLSVKQYMSFVANEGAQWFLSFVATIALAHVRLYLVVANTLDKILTYKPSYWWRVVIFMSFVIFLIVYFKLNRFLGNRTREQREKEKESASELAYKRVEALSGKFVKKK